MHTNMASQLIRIAAKILLLWKELTQQQSADTFAFKYDLDILMCSQMTLQATGVFLLYFYFYKDSVLGKKLIQGCFSLEILNIETMVTIYEHHSHPISVFCQLYRFLVWWQALFIFILKFADLISA